MPGVTLGKRVIVGAGSVVTKSFIQDDIAIAGNPAKIIKYLK
jgi:maltose O-acetyltransferase